MAPRGITAQRGGGVGLVDALIHHQDMRRPLGDATKHPRRAVGQCPPIHGHRATLPRLPGIRRSLPQSSDALV